MISFKNKGTWQSRKHRFENISVISGLSTHMTVELSLLFPDSFAYYQFTKYLLSDFLLPRTVNLKT